MKYKRIGVLICLLALALLIAGLCLFLPRANRTDVFGPRYALSPSAVAEGPDGVLYVADSERHVIFSVTQTQVELVCGALGESGADGKPQGGYADGAAKTARFDTPSAILAYRDGLLIADTGNRVLRYFDPEAGTVVTFAGTGENALVDGELQQAAFSAPRGMCLDDLGNLYVADAGAHAIRKIDSSGYVSTFLGGTAGNRDGSFDVAALNTPSDIAFSDGVFYIADTKNATVRVIEGGELLTLAGDGTSRLADGVGTAASFVSPCALAVHGGELWVSDFGAGALRRIVDGTVTTPLSAGADGLPLTCRDLCATEHGLYLADPTRQQLEVYKW